MKHLKTFSLLILFMGASCCRAQLGIGVSGTIGPTTVSYPSFNKFADSYNSYYSGIISQKLGKFNNSYTYDIMPSVLIFGLEAGCDIMKVNSSANVVFKNGDQRVFALSRLLYGIEFGYNSMKKDKRFFGGAYFGFAMGQTTVSSYFIYADGTVSHGNEQFWNGVYNAFMASPYLGVKAGYGFPKIFLRLIAKLDYVFAGGFGSADLEEWNLPRGNVAYNPRPANLPLNVSGYMSGAPYDYNGGFVQNKVSNFRFQLGLTFNLVGHD
jgi:hypothetical protein